jgi:hypothetical protein
MCTSMSPESRIVRMLTPGPVSSDASQVRRLAPRTSWVAFSARAMVGAAQGLGEPPLRRQRGGIGSGQPVRAGHVHGEQVAAGRARGDPGRPPDDRVALGTAGQRDHDPLARLPGAVDVVRHPVALQPLVDLVGEPEQGQLAQRGQVADAEVVGERGVDLLGLVDVAVRHPAAQRLGRHVDELDLIRGAHDSVGDGLALRHAGDLLDDVVVAYVEMLDIDRRDHVDARAEQLLDILPALLVRRAGHVAVRELVDERHLRGAGQHRVQVHLLEGRAAVGAPRPGDDLQVADL